jgi:hypothetical protein
MADKLGIPSAYLRRLRAEHLDLYDANVNGWLQRQPDRQLLVRTLRGRDAGRDGIARAVLSGRYRFVDNLDVLLAVLDGIRTAGADVRVAKCDLTERRMYVQIASQSVAARAATLLDGYVSPFTGAPGTDNPLVFAGFVLANSETGHGSFSITPRLIAQVCSNGYTITKDAARPTRRIRVDGPGCCTPGSHRVGKHRRRLQRREPAPEMRCSVTAHFQTMWPESVLAVLAGPLLVGTANAGTATTPVEDASVVSDWNATAVATLAGDTSKVPQEWALYLGFMHAAVYNAVVGVKGRYEPYRFEGRAPRGTSATAAAAAAAARSTDAVWVEEARRTPIRL